MFVLVLTLISIGFLAFKMLSSTTIKEANLNPITTPQLSSTPSLKQSTPISNTNTENAQQWSLKQSLSGHTAEIHAVALSTNGFFLASSSSDRTIKIWQTSSGQLFKTLTGSGDRVTNIAFSRDDNMLVSTGRDGWVRWWDTSKWTEHKLIRSRLEGSEIKFSANGKCLVVDINYHDAKVYRLPDLALINTFSYGKNNAIWSLDISPDCNLIAAVGFRGGLKIWDIKNGQIYPPINVIGSSTLLSGRRLRFDPTGSQVLLSEFNSLMFVDLNTFKIVKKIQVDADDGISFSPDGKILACLSTKKVTLLDAATDKILQVLENGTSNFFQSIAFSSDNSLIATPGENNQVLLWHRKGF